VTGGDDRVGIGNAIRPTRPARELPPFTVALRRLRIGLNSGRGRGSISIRYLRPAVSGRLVPRSSSEAPAGRSPLRLGFVRATPFDGVQQCWLRSCVGENGEASWDGAGGT
jgi:hypothetical protein